MADAVRCIHDFLPGQCGLCSKPSTNPPVYWDAKYEDTCPTCGASIHVGDRVRWTADGLHAEHARHGKP